MPNYSWLTKAVAPKHQVRAKWFHKVVAAVIVIAYLVFIGLGIWLTFA